MTKQKALTEAQQEILDVYLKLLEKYNRRPSRTLMFNNNVSWDRIRGAFGSMSKLVSVAKKYSPKSFEGSFEDEILSPVRHKEIKELVGDSKFFFITTAVTGCRVSPSFLKNIEAICKANNGVPLFLLSSDPAMDLPNKWVVDPILNGKHIVTRDLQINSNLFLSSIKISAKHIDPITSLERIGQRNGSFIYASPKQRLKLVPTTNGKLPHALMTTGACTKPYYQSQRYMSDRTAYIAKNDHIIGGIIVEVVNDKFYHFRQVQAAKDGSFIDLGIKYHNGKKSKVKAKAFVIGDYHAGETDPNVESAWMEVLNQVGSEYIVFHDLFNGKSISHHESKQKISRSLLTKTNKHNLKDELKMVADVLNKYTPFGKCVVSKSNHDEWLERYLQEGRYIDDPINFEIASECAIAMLNDYDPLEFIVEKLGLKEPKKVKWLMRDEEFKVARIELGAHGDQGGNGSRGSLRSMEMAYGQSVSGHSHVAEILRGAWAVGTSTFLKLSYNVGPSGWINSSCLVYPNGSRQLINVINGEWRAKHE